MKKFKEVKKYFSIIILSIFTMTMLGCNSEKKTVPTSNQAEKAKEIVASDQMLNAKQYDKLVQIGDKVITLPAKLTDFIEAGATITSKDLSENYIMDANSDKACEMSIGDTKFKLYLKNYTDKQISLKDADIKYIEATKGKTVFFAEGIAVGSKLDDLTEKWGQPSFNASKDTDKVITYCYYDYSLTPERLKLISAGVSQQPISGTGNEYTVTIDRNTSIITSIQYKWSKTDISDVSTLKSYSEDIKYGSEKFKLSYEIPNYLLQNEDKKVAIYSIDNVPYIIFTDRSLQGLGNTKDGITDKNITSTINNGGRKYTVEMLKKTDNEAYACGYFQTGNSLKCETLYMNKEHFYMSYNWQIAPFDENGTLTDSAIAKFKEIVSNFTQSIHETKA